MQGVRRLVEQDKVFAVFNTLGTESNLAIRDYLNQSKVPHLFAASGATTWGRDAAKYPWTIGFQPSYAAEGFVYGKYVAGNLKKARIAVLFQNDDYGKDLLGGLKSGLGRSGSKVVAAEPYAGDLARRRVADREAQGLGRQRPRRFRDADLRDPGLRLREPARLEAARLLNGVSGTSNIMVLASEGGKNKAVEGTITEHDPQGPDRPALEERSAG